MMRNGIAMIAGIFLVAACSTNEQDVRTASEAASAAWMAEEAEDEYKKSQDFDKIAEDSVSGVDTSDFDALSN